MTEDKLKAIAEKHNIYFGVGIPFEFLGKDTKPDFIYMDFTIEIPEYGGYVISVRSDDIIITHETIEGLLEDWNNHIPDRDLWIWQQDFIDKGQWIPQDIFLGVSDGLEAAHEQFWELICDLYLNHLEDEDEADILDLLSE